MTAVAGGAYADLRRARRRSHLDNIDWFDAFYRAYVTALLTAAAFVVLAGLVGDRRVAPAQVHDVTVHGPAVVSLVLAVAVAARLRSGARGGPLAVEAAEVNLALLAPIPRDGILRGQALRQLRTTLFLGAAAGAALGVVASHRLPHGAPVWIAVGAIAGLVVGALLFGAALCASVFGAGMRTATVAGGVLLLWSWWDLAAEHVTSPLTRLGQLVLYPMTPTPAAWTGAAVSVGGLVLAVVGAGELRLETLARRSTLIGQLRFAVTTRDLRAIVLVRRQLADERPRSSPWIRLRPGASRRGATWRRGWNGVLRWPAARVLRSIALGLAGGVALVGFWRGTRALLGGAALVLWLAALDATEAVAQEVEHPDLAASFPRSADGLTARHLPVAAVVMAAVSAAMAVPLAIGVGHRALWGAMASIVSVAMAGAVGGTVAAVVRPPETTVAAMIMYPEAAGGRMVMAAVRPPALVAIGLVPVVVARYAASLPVSGLFAIACADASLLAAATLLWLRVRVPLAAAFARLVEQLPFAR